MSSHFYSFQKKEICGTTSSWATCLPPPLLFRPAPRTQNQTPGSCGAQVGTWRLQDFPGHTLEYIVVQQRPATTSSSSSFQVEFLLGHRHFLGISDWKKVSGKGIFSLNWKTNMRWRPDLTEVAVYFKKNSIEGKPFYKLHQPVLRWFFSSTNRKSLMKFGMSGLTISKDKSKKNTRIW